MDLLQNYFPAHGPGAALAIVVDDAPPQVSCRGLADPDADIAIDPATVFDLASAAKPFTAAAIMTLVEDGRLSLTTPICDCLSFAPPAEKGRPATVRDLLQHTSGLPDYLAQGMHTPAEEMTLTSIVARTEAWSRSARPGRIFEYSNTNYALLAMIVEAVAGADFAEFVHKRLFAPHGLEDAFIGQAENRGKTVAKGFINGGYGLAAFEPIALDIDTVGDGGLYCSLRDLVRWQTLFWQGAIVNPASLAAMTAPGRLDSGEPFDYGLGLQVETGADGARWIGHGGSWVGTTVLAGRYPAARASVIVLSNEHMAPVERISQRAYANLARV